MFYSAVIPISTSFVSRNRNEKNQKELNKRLRKLLNNPDISDEQKIQFIDIINSNPYS